MRPLLVLLLAAAPALADPITSFEACIGPEYERRAVVAGLSAMCGDGERCDFDPVEDASDWFFTVGVACFSRAIDDCTIEPNAQACLATVSDLVSDRRQALIAAIPDARVEAAAAHVNPLRARSLRQNVDRLLRNPGKPPCSFGPALEAALSLKTGQLCRTYEASSAWINARMFLRMVNSAEASAADGEDKGSSQ